MKLALAWCVMLSFVIAAPLARADKVDLKKSLVGKWQPAEEKSVTIEFKADGKLEVKASAGSGTPMTLAGSYKWVDAETIEIKVAMGSDAKTEKVKIAIDGDKLTTTDEKKKVEKFTRVK